MFGWLFRRKRIADLEFQIEYWKSRYEQAARIAYPGGPHLGAPLFPPYPMTCPERLTADTIDASRIEVIDLATGRPVEPKRDLEGA